MTSKNLFFNLMKENVKRRLWAVALSILGFIFAFPVYAVLSLGRWAERVSENITNAAGIYVAYGNKIIGIGNMPLIILTVGLAVINGLQGMAHLHSRKKTDMYNSTPVKRSVYFAVSYLNGFLIYALPYLFFLIVTIIMGAANGYVNGASLEVAGASYLTGIVMYLLIYTVVTLAGILTGNIIVSILGSAVLLAWGSAVYYILNIYKTTFYMTYYAAPDSDDIITYFSPVLCAMNLCSKMGEERTYMQYTGWMAMTTLICAFAAAVLVILCAVLYKKRPAEASGHALAFEHTKPLIKVIIMIPVSLAAGQLFSDIGSDRGWMIFGIIAGLIITHAVVEIIYEFDFRAAFRHFISTGIAAVLAAFIACFYIFDLGGYDSYVPDASDVSYAALTSDSLQSAISIYDKNGSYVDTNTYRLNNMKLKCIDDVNAIAVQGIPDTKKYRSECDNNKISTTSYTIITMRWTMNSGRKVYRQYTMDLEQKDASRAYDNIYATKEYKDAVYPILTADDASVKNLYYTSPCSEEKMKLSKDQTAALLQTYRTELYMQNADDIRQNSPVGEITSHVNPVNSADYQYPDYYMQVNEWYIYPSFTKTIALLKQDGIDVYAYADTDNIENIVVSDYSGYNTKSETFTDTGKIKQIMEASVPAFGAYMNTGLNYTTSETNQLDVTVIYKDGFVETESPDDGPALSSMQFISSRLPDFIHYTPQVQ